MQATLHDIEARLTDDELAPASVANFRLGPGQQTDPRRAVDEAGWSLYALDLPTHLALFLDVGPEVDLARSAFAKATQFRLARRALQVPFERLDDLAASAPPPERLVFVFSIGRCGSTLVHTLLNEVDGVWSLSEPDFAFGMLMQRATVDPGEARRLLAAGIRLSFRPPAGCAPSTMAVKFRKQELHQAGHYHAAFPDARYVFLYRDGATWVRSFWYMLANFGLPPTLDREARRFLWWIESANSDPALLDGIVDMQAETVYPEELLAASWARDLAEYRRLLVAGVPFLAIRYDQLDADRAAVTERLLHHCGLPPAAAPAALRAFERDSQAGTRIARDRREAIFTDANLARFRATLVRCPGAVHPDAFLPDATSP